MNNNTEQAVKAKEQDTVETREETGKTTAKGTLKTG